MFASPVATQWSPASVGTIRAGDFSRNQMTKTYPIMLRVDEALNAQLKKEAKKCNQQSVILQILSSHFGVPYNPPRVGKRKKQ